MPSKITLLTQKHDNKNKYKHSHISKPHVNKLLHDKNQSNTHQNKEKSKSKAKENTTKNNPKTQSKTNAKNQGLLKEKNCNPFYLPNKKPNKDLSQPTKNFLQPTTDLS